ncbi:hypothetical protein DL96DRAFT_1044405 [Flagelloscypha sp. PMI_526]|nr:hypothetical protein DL96DRAFT_1044405 [Flagelloscypha sp. PMI_526]
MAARSLASLNLRPPSLVALHEAGYQTIQDLQNATAESLAQDTNLTIPVCGDILNLINKHRPSAHFVPPLSQSVSTLAESSKRVSTGCAALDSLLGGGLMPNIILEISGLPGCPKELLVCQMTKSYILSGSEVVYVDTSNALIPESLQTYLSDTPVENVSYLHINTLEQLFMFLHNISEFLNRHPKTDLLVLDSLSALFQRASPLSPANCLHLEERLRNIFSQITTVHRLAIVTTSTLATKVLNEDGSASSFSLGGRGVLTPALGSTYLPANKSWRISVVPKTQGQDGVLRVLSSPNGKRRSLPLAPYTLVFLSNLR